MQLTQDRCRIRELSRSREGAWRQYGSQHGEGTTAATTSKNWTAAAEEAAVRDGVRRANG
jgi:hypothetical protein